MDSLYFNASLNFEPLLAQAQYRRHSAQARQTMQHLKAYRSDEVLFGGQGQTQNLNDLQRLGQAYGIDLFYWNLQGQKYNTSDETLRKLLQAMGVSGVDNPALAFEQLENSRWQRFLQPVQVVRKSSLDKGLTLTLHIPEHLKQETVNWQLITEQGLQQSGSLQLSPPADAQSRQINGQTFTRLSFTLPLDAQTVEMGYHTLRLFNPAKGLNAEMRLIITPQTCYQPPALNNNGRVWGPALQISSLRSARNWGAGDFNDLAQIARWCAREGAGLVGIDPLHALNLQNPASASRYSPVSRMFLHPLDVNVETIPEFEEWQKADNTTWTPQLQERIKQLRASKMVDFQGVAQVKLTVLKALYQYFRTEHLAKNTPRAAAFRSFQQQGGESLRRFSVFQALQEQYQGKGWPAWDAVYQDADNPKIAEFAAQNTERIEFFQYLQWITDSQLEAINRTARQEGSLPLGLYRDVAIGSDMGGFDVWQHPHLYSAQATVGAPPDPLGPQGQNWGLPPLIPHKMQEVAYKPFIEIIRANMRHAGALRIDHVAGLNRLFWIPMNEKPLNGAYVNYPFEDLLGIIALESHRNKCLIIGEDLGTIPPVVHQKMKEWNVLSYKVSRWERHWDDTENGQPFKKPHEYPALALVCFSTHDTSTLLGQLTGWLYNTWQRLKILPTDALEKKLQENDKDNRALVEALKQEGLLPHDFSFEGLKQSLAQMPSQVVQQVVEALHRFMARTPSQLAMFRFEDALQVEEQINVPGTADADVEDSNGDTRKYPNWRLKLPVTVEQIPGNAGIQGVVNAMRGERGKAG